MCDINKCDLLNKWELRRLAILVGIRPASYEMEQQMTFGLEEILEAIITRLPEKG